MAHRAPVRALASVGASVMALGSLLVGGLVSAPSAVGATTPGTPWTWGENTYGQLGNGSTTTRLSAAPVSGLSGVVDLHGGREHVVALRSDGSVWTWGSNAEGQLGLGTTANRSVPTEVTSLGKDNVAVETGHNLTVVLKSDGSVRTAGLNSDGQLGDGTTTLRRSPVRVQGLTDAVAIAAGRDMTYAIRSNGQLVGWGRNDEGQLGDGTLTRRPAPVRVGTLSNVVRVAGGRDHGLAVLADGSAWSWGSNDYAQVGDGTQTDRTSPVRIIASGIEDVAGGAHHSYALRTDGTVASWGRNYRANLGDGTTTMRSRPVSVLGVSGATTIGSGRDMGVVTLADGRVKTWGHNAFGQLGDGTTTNRTSAVFVPGITDAVKAAGGGSAYGVALVGDGTPPANARPVARITGSCTNLSCPLSGSTSSDSDGMIVGYEWDFGEGSPASGPSPGHTYSAPGTYTVRLTVTDDDGATGTATQVVAVDDGAPPPNQDPVARITGSCTNLVCPLRGDTSSDDGTIESYAWSFGDGSTATGPNPGHTYSTAGTYPVTLTVTDDDGASDTDSLSVTVSAAPAASVAFRAAAARDANTTSATVVVPTSVQTGDQLVLVGTTNNLATATTPSGWTLRGSVVDSTQMRSSVWTRTAVAGVAGSTVRVAISTTAKTSLLVLAYSGAAPVTTAVSQAHTTASSTSHTAPSATVATAGSTVVRYWADKSSTTRTWTVPGSVTRRSSTTGTGGGLLAAVAGDATGVPAGATGTSTATSSVASDKAVGWTIVVPPA